MDTDRLENDSSHTTPSNPVPPRLGFDSGSREPEVHTSEPAHSSLATNFFLLPSQTSPTLNAARADRMTSLRELVNSHPGLLPPATPSRNSPSNSESTLGNTDNPDPAGTPVSSRTSNPAETPSSAQISGRIRSASVAFGDEAHDTSNPQATLVKYQRLAMEQGCTPEQAIDVAKAAFMTPRSARVIDMAHVVVQGNLINKLQAAQAGKPWDMPEKLKEGLVQGCRIAVLTPMPYAFKHERISAVYSFLKAKKYLPKDLKKHPHWKTAIEREIGSVLRRSRSNMKTKISQTLVPDAPRSNIYKLCEDIISELTITENFNITEEVLTGLAWMRGHMDLEMVNDSLGREMWDVLDVRLRELRLKWPDERERAEHLKDWLRRDEGAHGAIPSNVRVKSRFSSFQSAVVNVMRVSGSDEAEGESDDQ